MVRTLAAVVALAQLDKTMAAVVMEKDQLLTV
jgi:hypothetical protein